MEENLADIFGDTWQCKSTILNGTQKPSRSDCSWRMRCIAISIISVFLMRAWPWPWPCVQSVATSRPRSARQLLMRSRRRFSMTRCDWQSCTPSYLITSRATVQRPLVQFVDTGDTGRLTTKETQVMDKKFAVIFSVIQSVCWVRVSGGT